MKITLQDMRSMPCATGSGYCSRGARQWADKHKLDWQKFITDGIEEEELSNKKDAMADRLVEWTNNGR